MPPKPLRVAAIQMPHGNDLESNLAEAEGMIVDAQHRGVGLALLPEYFFATFGDTRRPDPARLRAFYAETSAAHQMTIAGNLIEAGPDGPVNSGVVYANGHEILTQHKIHPMPREVQDGIQAGAALRPADVDGHAVGMLVCSDILYPEAARILALQGTEILLNPVMSPHNPNDLSKEAREALYVGRAYDAGAFVIKAGGYHRGEPAVVGRSLIAAPWGLLARYADEYAPEVLTADLDFDKLAAFRAHQAKFPARRPEAYADLVAKRGEA